MFQVTSEGLSQLPVQEVLRGTDDCVLWIFIISSVFMFSGSQESIANIPTELPFSGENENVSIYVFEVKESIADIPTELPCFG